DANVFAFLESVGQGQKARSGHAISGVGVQTWNVDGHLPCDDCQPNTHQHADHEDGGEHARRRIQSVQPTAHAYCARYVSMTCLPSAPAFSSHSLSMVWPTLSRPLMSSAEGLTISMPFFARLSRYHWVFSRESSQPRFSAASAAFSRASLLFWSSASKAFLLTRMAFLGSQAWVS